MKRKPVAAPVEVPADPEQWSDESKNSIRYLSCRVTTYQDISYKCSVCKAACIFSAQDQQHAYEVKQAYIAQGRKLCALCWTSSRENQAALQTCAARWRDEKTLLQNDLGFLTAWRGLIEESKKYRSNTVDTAAMTMLTKLIDKHH